MADAYITLDRTKCRLFKKENDFESINNINLR